MIQTPYSEVVRNLERLLAEVTDNRNVVIIRRGEVGLDQAEE
jgi:hypothetical protein